MKKAFKALTTLGGAALAVIGGIFVYRRFFAKEEELEGEIQDLAEEASVPEEELEQEVLVEEGLLEEEMFGQEEELPEEAEE